MSKAKSCDLCKKHAASVHYTEVADGQVSKQFICRECAESRGLLDEAAPSLEELMSSISKPARRAATEHVGPCRQCGLEFAEFQSEGRLGCPECYVAFEPQLKPLLRQIHEHWQHAGKRPAPDAKPGSTWARVDALQRELDAAIAAEQYERAAELRDEIRKARQALEPPATAEAEDEEAS